MASLCLGCMRLKNSSPVCEHCGFDERTQNLPHQLPVGTTLNNQYLVGRVLGQGGFGITYMGWDQNLAVPVAIKEYFPSGVVQRHTRMGTGVFGVNGEAPEAFEKHKQRFLKEARTLAQLADIPEIVQIRSFFSANGTAYIVMEYVQGITLKEHLKKLGRPMTDAEALAIMEPVLRGLQKVHDQGLIHRDISPDNIMLPGNGGIKLIDFGTVRYMDDSGKSKSTEAVLKPGFAPMEQYNTRGNLGTWTDVYALCATFHYLLTGRVPPEAMERLEQGETLTLLRSRPGISGKLADALEQGMRLRVSDRLQTVQELHRLLYTAPKPKAPPPPKKAAVKKEPVKAPSAAKPAKKSGKLLLAAGLLAAVLSIGIGLSLTRKAPEVPDTLSSVPTDPLPTQTAPEVSFTPEELQYREAEALEAAGEYGKAAIAFGKLGSYEDARQRSFQLWRAILPPQTISAGNGGAAVIKQDGSVHHLTAKDERQYSAVNWRDIVSVSVGHSTTVGLKSDGTALSLGSHDVSDWTDLIAIDASQTNVIGLKSDGTVVVTGHQTEGLCDDWQDIVAVSASSHLVGLKADGTVVASGNNGNGQCDVSHWQDIIAIDSDSFNGTGITVGLKSNGTVVSTGSFTNLSEWTDLIAVAAGIGESDYFIAGLKADGTVIAAGTSPIVKQVRQNNWWRYGSIDPVVAISAGRLGLMALTDTGKLMRCGEGLFLYQQKNFLDIKIPDVLPNRVPDSAKTPPETEPAPVDPADAYAEAEALLASGDTASAAIAFGKLADYKDARERSFALWDQVAHRDTIATSQKHTVAVKNDGTVVATGDNTNHICNVQNWTDIIAISAGSNITVGLKSDGTVVAAGYSTRGQMPDLSQWEDIAAIDVSALGFSVYGLKIDGTVVTTSNQSQVATWTNAIAISQGAALKADGTVVTIDYSNLTNHWTDMVAISSPGSYIIGLKSNGTVLVAGNNTCGQCNVQDWQDIQAMDTGLSLVNNYTYGTVGLKSDGTVIAAGSFAETAWHDLSGLAGVAAVSTSAEHTVALRHDGTVVAVGNRLYGRCNVDSWTDIRLPNK